MPPSGAPPQRTTGGGMKWTPPSTEHLQRMLPQYEIVSMLGHGGMGAVYQARQKSLDRMVAIKILPPDAADDEAQFIARFQNEARTMAKMNHPAIVSVYDFGETQEGQLYFVMEFVDGTDVAQMIKSQGKLPPDHALAITAHVCDALDYAHNHGVIHRDIKPANILINREGQVKVADFGLAKLDDPSATTGLTKSHMAMGTPDFVAPEVLSLGVTVDHRADLYAIGVMLYQMLTGEIPRGMFRMPSEKVGGDPRFDAIISKAMESDRETRYQTALEVRHDLDRILTTPMVQAGDEQGGVAIPKRSLPQKPAAHAPHQPGGGNAGTPARQDSATLHSSGHSQKKSSTGLYLGLTATAVVLGGVVFLLSTEKKAIPEPVAGEKPIVAKVKPVSQPPKPKTPKPAPVASKDPPAPFTAPVPNLTAKAVDVLPTVNLAQDVVEGTWEMRPDGLAYGKRKGIIQSRVELPLTCSGNYIIEVEFSTMPSSGDLVLHLPFAKEGSAGQDDVSMMVDRGKTQRAGFAYFERESIGGKRNPAWVDLASPLGQNSRLTVKVELKGQGILALGAWLDGKPLVGWEGDRNLLTGAANVWRPKNQPRFAIGTSLDGTVFHRVRVEALDGEIQRLRHPATIAKVQSATTPIPVPAPPAAPDTVDSSPWPGAIPLLPLVDLEKDTVQAGWERKAGDLVSNGKRNPALVELPVIPPEEYDLRVHFTRKAGSECISLVLSRGARSFAWHGGVYGNTVFGFGNHQGALGVKTQNSTVKTVESCFETDRSYDLQIAVRKTGVAAYLDGAKISELAADLAEMQPPETLKLKTAGALGVASFKTSYAVHAMELREITGKVKFLREPPAPDLVTQRLAQLEQQFLAAYETQVGATHKAAVADLNAKFSAALDRSIATASQAGNLDEALALRNERTLIQTSGTVPDEDAADTTETVKGLRKTYRAAMVPLLANRDKLAAPLHAAYDRALEAYQAELTQQQQLDGALKVKAARRPVTPDKPVVANPPSTPNSTPPPKPAASTPASGGSTWRRAAEWALSKGAKVSVNKDGGRNVVVTDVKDLPPGRFDVVAITLGKKAAAAGNWDEEMKVLNGLKTLQHLALPSAPISGQGLANLKGMTKLETLDLNGTLVNDEALASLSGLTNLTELKLDLTSITDAGMPSLAPLTKLKVLQLGARGVRGETLDKLAGCKELTELCLGGGPDDGVISLTDAGVQALAKAALPALKRLYIKSDKVTDAGIAHLAGMKLTYLSLDPSAGGAGLKALTQIATLEDLQMGGGGLTDEEFSVLNQLKYLKRLSIYSVDVTDAGLKILLDMPALQQVSFKKSKTTPEGRAEIMKARQNLKLGG